MGRLFRSLLGSTVLWACSPAYAPAAFQIPQFDHRHEVQLGGSLGSNGSLTGGTVHAAYAFAPHVFVKGQGQFAGGGTWEGPASYTAANVGIGFFWATQSQNDPLSGWRGSFSAEGGAGRSRWTQASWWNPANHPTPAESPLWRTAAQADFGYEGERFAAGFVARAVLVSFGRIISESEQASLKLLCGEPGLFFRVGTRHVKADIQIGSSIPLSDDTFLSTSFANYMFGSVGVVAEF
jgi:hypothetical protein